MKHKSGIKSVFILYILLAVMLVAALFSAAVYYSYITTVKRPDGQLSGANWPQQYAASFEKHIMVDKGAAQISEEGRASLLRNGLWLQILDRNGYEVAQYNKPENIPEKYSLSEILKITHSNQLDGFTVFAVSMENGSYEYLIGFPIAINKVTRFFNSGRYMGGWPIARGVLTGICVLLFLAVLIYGIWLTKHITKIVKSAEKIAARKYVPIKQKGAFGDAYDSLNTLNGKMTLNDSLRADTERMREEWIVNITHDLKTPLSPIKGYAELLADERYDLTPEEIKSYGQAILKNAAFTEQLMNDLKLTYRINSGTFPLHMKTVNLAREIKEIVIDILNNPNYSNRSIIYLCEDNEIPAYLDTALLRRAVSNVIINAIVHNPAETKITVAVETKDCACISIRDNGNGLTKEEMRKLFTRYYRGGNTAEKTEGSGLGLAIAKQIVELHSGKIDVQSTLGIGTNIIIHLPKLK